MSYKWLAGLTYDDIIHNSNRTPECVLKFAVGQRCYS